MIGIHSVVAATDLSAAARRAADRAARIARDASASLTLVHAVNTSALDELRRWLEQGEDAEQSILDDARTRLHELVPELADRHRIKIDERTVVGRPVDEIARVAEELQADLIVTGTLGARLFSQHVVGSTAERVLKKSARPVLMVRQSAYESYRRVLVPVDFSRWSAPSLEIAAAVAPDAHLVLVHCVQVPFEGQLRRAEVDIDRCRALARDEAITQLAELAARAGLPQSRWTPLAPTGLDTWMQIVQQEQAQGSDLTVIGKHGRNAVEELLLGSTTNMVIAEGASDVLISTRAEATWAAGRL
jgi:nucleotide-binding universal stress UspA family protein